MNREYCCSKCGLIWFGKNTSSNEVKCPECGNAQGEYGIYACDTFGWFYASETVEKELNSRGLKIHYAKDHPLYNKTS